MNPLTASRFYNLSTISIKHLYSPSVRMKQTELTIPHSHYLALQR